MQNHVTFETSVRLKEAGFPQPKPEEGQFWYNPKTERLCAILFNRANWSFRVSYFGSVSNKGGYFKDNFVFAPTAQDILKVLFPVDIRGQIGAMDILRLALDVERAATAYLAAAQAFLNLEAKP